MQRLQRVQHGAQVGPPDIAAIDHADGQHGVSRQHGLPRGQLLRCAHQIDMKTVHGQRGGTGGVGRGGVEVGGQQQLDPGSGQRGVGGVEGVEPGRIEVQAQGRLVDLHPFDAARLELGEDAGVGRHHLGQQAQAVEPRHVGFGQPQVGHRPDQHRTRGQAERQRLVDFVEIPGRTAVEGGFGIEFRHQVVVVRIEPLGHFHGRLTHVAARQFVVLRERQRGRVETEAPGQGTEQRGGQARIGLQLPVAAAQRGAGLAQRGFGRLAAPERLLREFQFTARADARKAEDVGACHVWAPEMGNVRSGAQSLMASRMNQATCFKQYMNFIQVTGCSQRQ
ncbi:hypothetical protein D3C86_1361710 [compost metagenome]